MNPAKRITGGSEENPCPAKKPRRKAGIRAKQGFSELSGGFHADLFAFHPPFPQTANQPKRLRFEKEEQRRECAPAYQISRSKRYKACSDVAGGFHSDLFAFHPPFPQTANQRKRLRFEKEEQRRECAPTYKISRSKRYKACSDVAEMEGFEPPHALRRLPDFESGPFSRLGTSPDENILFL